MNSSSEQPNVSVLSLHRLQNYYEKVGPKGDDVEGHGSPLEAARSRVPQPKQVVCSAPAASSIPSSVPRQADVIYEEIQPAVLAVLLGGLVRADHPIKGL